jgi:predicted DNA-binding WGR domain protein
MAKVKAESTPTFTDYEVPAGWILELNSFDITGENNKTKGTSNKFYHMELQVSKCGTKHQLFTQYGPTGRVQANEYRFFGADRLAAEAEFNSIKKAKLKKGYVEIDVAQRTLGSDEAKKHVKAVTLKNAETIPTAPKSTMTTAQQSIVSLFFNAQDTWVAQNLKCPLGQLTNNQIDLGRAALNEAKIIVNKNSTLSDDVLKELTRLTNSFYGLIPHNLGSGARGQMLELRLDTLDKIVGKETDLDTLLDAKQVNAVLKADSTLDDKYRSLNCDFGEVEPGTDLWKFLVSYFAESKVNGHGYHSSRVTRIWTMKRKDSKEAAFNRNMEAIAKQAGSHTFASDTIDVSGGKSKLWTPDQRPDLNKEERDLYKRANVWLCWHGTRSANLVGITRRGLLIRPAGAAYTGSMFGDGKYMAWQSSKSLGYTDHSYWTGGNRNDSNLKRYMFLLDAALGNMYKVTHSQFFKCPPKGFHSVYGKAGGALRNDEMITYDFKDEDNQSGIRYLFEITG